MELIITINTIFAIALLVIFISLWLKVQAIHVKAIESNAKLQEKAGK